jgi:hypothetical protein
LKPFNHIQGGSSDSLTTHHSKYYKDNFTYCKSLLSHIDLPIIDLFARNCKWADITNDLDLNTTSKFHLDALDFIKLQPSSSSKLILFDPPFSHSQSLRYDIGSTNLYAADSNKISNIYQQSFRVLCNNGIFLKLGYNSTRPHKGFQLLSLSLVNFGGSRNDVIVSIWIKSQSTLEAFI